MGGHGSRGSGRIQLRQLNGQNQLGEVASELSAFQSMASSLTSSKGQVAEHSYDYIVCDG